jgi:hypothetical protein
LLREVETKLFYHLYYYSYMQVWETIKTYALKPILGVPAVAVAGVVAVAAYLLMKKKGRGRRLW